MSTDHDKMSTNAEQNWQLAQRLHRELRVKVKERDSPLADIENLIQQLRVACETTIFSDFDFATKQGVENILWDSHSLINNRYRKIVAKYRNPEQSKSVVERRKWEKRYADFLKTSQFYYKGYVQRLASHFKGLEELRIIADRLTLSTLSADDAVKVSKNTKEQLLSSCHSTLLRLGDLCRYRVDLNLKERNWEKANAYYALANDLNPDLGSAFNQMAVISLANGNHLDAVYHLYRALAVKVPHALAEGNLEIEFKKILNAWLGGGQKKNGPSVAPPLNTKDYSASMVLWFVRLHAKLYKGEEFSNHDELENEVLSQIPVLLKDQSLEGTLDKIVLINTAAEYFAGVRLARSGADELFQAYCFFLRLNIRMLFMLLQLLQPELDIATHDSDTPDVNHGKAASPAETITAVTRRILPALRQYSTWLVAAAPVIVSQVGSSSINVHIREMWSMYCTTLSLLVTAFPVAQLPDVDYLLEEDAATVGFKPFRDCKDCQTHTNPDGSVKQRSTDPDVERFHPNVEMSARIRGILRDGMLLATAEADGQKKYPIYVVDGEFRFVEDGLSAPSPPLNSTDGLPDVASQKPSAYSFAQHVNTVPPPHSDFDGPTSLDASESQQSLSTDMHQMVEDLLTPQKEHSKHTTNFSNETSYGMHSTTALDVFGAMQNSQDLPRPKMHTRVSGFPGFSPSPFSPRPGELQSSATDRSMASDRLGELNRHSARHHIDPLQPASTHNTSLNSSPHSPWNRSNLEQPREDAPPRYNAATQLQQSLAALYQSSDFSNPSSIYENTPQFGQQALINRVAPRIPNVQKPNLGTTDYERCVLLQSSAWDGGQPPFNQYKRTPPGGQGS